MIAHTLGNPFDLDAVVDFCRRHNLWLVEDAATRSARPINGQQVGTFGDLATTASIPRTRSRWAKAAPC